MLTREMCSILIQNKTLKTKKYKDDQNRNRLNTAKADEKNKLGFDKMLIKWSSYLPIREKEIGLAVFP